VKKTQVEELREKSACYKKIGFFLEVAIGM
jgi:hypothetical protein